MSNRVDTVLATFLNSFLSWPRIYLFEKGTRKIVSKMRRKRKKIGIWKGNLSKN